MTETQIPYQEFSMAETRNRVVREFEGAQRKAVTYDLAFDRATFNSLATLKSQPELYEKKKAEVRGYTQTQLKTTLSERFNVLSSTIRYNIQDGVLYGENTDEPFMNMLVRGREYRKAHGNSLDHDREQAEVEGFSLIEAALCDKKTSVGTMMVSISPQGSEGSVYQHNFYDVYTLQEDANGRYIDFRRYSAGLTRDEFAVKASEIDVSYSSSQVPTDTDFLRRPIRLDTKRSPFASADDVHEYFHTDHDYMTEAEFQSEVWEYCAPLVLSYINTLCENPEDLMEQSLIFNAILNKADLRAEWLQRRKDNPSLIDEGQMVFVSKKALQEEINYLGRLAVKVVNTGCGELGGASLDGASPFTSPWSVSSFANSEVMSFSGDKKLKCTCPFCDEKVEALISQNKITCPNCDKSAPYDC